MSKDFCFAKNMEEAGLAHSLLKIEDEFLGRIYEITSVQKEKYPLLWHLVEDFYGDFLIERNKLSQLIREIDSILLQFPEIEKEYVYILKKIKLFAQKGIQKRKDLFAVAD